jgi:hypothetical protein
MTTGTALTAIGQGVELTIGAIGAPATIQAGRASGAGGGVLGGALTRAGKWGGGAADSARPGTRTNLSAIVANLLPIAAIGDAANF